MVSSWAHACLRTKRPLVYEHRRKWMSVDKQSHEQGKGGKIEGDGLESEREIRMGKNREL